MIVRNESAIITRLLGSVKDVISTYCICDTGSTDDTISIIKNYFDALGISGKIVQEPFKNFGYNRTFALRACDDIDCDYLLFLDADMILSVGKTFTVDSLTADCYHVLQGSESFYYPNARICKKGVAEKYECVTHEYLKVPEAARIIKLGRPTLFIIDIGDGGCKADKFERDIRLLTQGIIDEPQHAPRYHFYLGNSYHDSGKYEEAIPIYRKRIEYGGWEQEVWYSYYRIGHCYKKLGRNAEAVSAWLDGYNYLPTRLENIYEIADHYKHEAKYKLADVFYRMGVHVQDLIKAHNINIDEYLFLNKDVYVYKLSVVYLMIAYYLGVRDVSSHLLTILNNTMDPHTVSLTLTNMKFYKQVLKPLIVHTLKNTHPSHTIGGVEYTFNNSSGSILPYRDKTTNAHYMMCVRYVNYCITEKGGYTGAEKFDISMYSHVLLNKDFKVISEVLIEPRYDARHYIGAQDLKIWRDPKGCLVYTGTGYHMDSTVGVVIGDYTRTIADCKLCDIDIKPEFKTGQACEKNWVYAPFKGETHMIYNWYPLRICKPQSNKLTLVTEREMPRIFRHARGSTNGCVFGDEIWFIVHIVSYESPRWYYHLFAIFDMELRLKRYTYPIKFSEDSPIEYVLGLVVENSRVIVVYSEMDRCTKIGVYSKDQLMANDQKD